MQVAAHELIALQYNQYFFWLAERDSIFKCKQIRVSVIGKNFMIPFISHIVNSP